MLKIEFEGTDGSGKTTALKYFVEKAKEKGISVVETREVGNPHIPICVKLRELVLSPDSGLCGESMELLFSAMRYENDRWLKQLIKSKDSPTLVVSDRGWFSHLAYTENNVSPEFTDAFYEHFMQYETLLPDVVIYFKVDTEVALKRRVRRGEALDIIEMKGIEFQNEVRDSFVSYIDQYREKGRLPHYFEVDANQSIEGVKHQLDFILNILCHNSMASLAV